VIEGVLSRGGTTDTKTMTDTSVRPGATLDEALRMHRSFLDGGHIPAVQTLRAEPDVVDVALCYRLVGQPTIELEALGITRNATVVQLPVDRPSTGRRVMRGVDEVRLAELPAWLHPHIHEEPGEHWMMLGLHHLGRICWWLVDVARYQGFVERALLLSNPTALRTR
jgi:hypothetical protein